jgi:GxxExxY protein
VKTKCVFNEIIVEGKMHENSIAKAVVNAAYKVHSKLGPGLFESVYEVILADELEEQGLQVNRQKSIPIRYGRKKFDQGFIADLIINDAVIVELKSVEKVAPVHKKQLLTYLRLSDKKLGLLINFGESSLKDGISRVVNGL